MSMEVNFTEKLIQQNAQVEQPQKALYSKTNDYPEDSVELSNKEDGQKNNKKSLYLKIAGAVVAVAAVIGGIIALRRGRGEKAVKNVAEHGKNQAEHLADDIKQGVEHLGSTSDSKFEKPLSDSHVKEPANSEGIAPKTNDAEPKTDNFADEMKKRELELAEARKKAELAQMKRNSKAINKTLNIYYGRQDDEVAEIIYNHYKYEMFPSHKFSDEFLKDKKLFDRILNDAVEKAAPQDKERLLTKLFEFKQEVPIGDSYKRETLAALSEIKGKFEELYKTPGVEFKGGMVEKVSAKFNEIFQSTKGAKNLKDIMGSEADYELFQKLLKKSETYEDIWHKKTNPMSQIEFMYDKKEIVSFLNDVLPEVIKEEKNLLKQEDLWMKYFMTHKQYNNKMVTHEDFVILKNMSEALYKNADKLPKGASFKHKAEVDKKIKELIDVFIFKKFDIPEIKSDDEIMILADRVIKKGNSWFTQPNDIDFKKVSNALYGMGLEMGNEKYYKAAINLAEKNKANDFASELSEKILKDETISKEFRQTLENLQKAAKAQAKKIADELAESLDRGTLDELFETLKTNPEITKAVKGLAEKNSTAGKLTEAQVFEKFKQGDYYTIYHVIDDASLKTPKNSKLWDDMIQYLGKIDGVVKNPEELEKLKNLRALFVGNKVLELRKTNPDMANAYMEVLKTELRDMLYAKGKAGELAENLQINEELIDRVADQISHIWISFTPTYTVFGALDRLLEKEMQFRAMGPMANAYASVNNHKMMSDELLEVLKLKRQEVKTRLKIRTADDFYQDYYSRYGKNNSGARASKLGKESAIDVLNKYLPEDAKLKPDASKGDIKSAYRELALKHHPDKAASEEEKVTNETIFKEIGAAYEALR